MGEHSTGDRATRAITLDCGPSEMYHFSQDGDSVKTRAKRRTASERDIDEMGENFEVRMNDHRWSYKWS